MALAKEWSEQRILQLQRQQARLKHFLGHLRFPKPSHFLAFGQEFTLPLESTVLQEEPPPQLLEYLGGIFDSSCWLGFSGSSKTQPVLQSKRSARESIVLFLLLKSFGGRVVVSSNASGTTDVRAPRKFDAVEDVQSLSASHAISRRPQGSPSLLRRPCIGG